MTAIDHIIWATPDLDACVKGFAKMTGVEPRIGGSHPGLGTRNALLSLGAKLYLEIIGPDPAQDLTDTYGGVFAKLSAPGMFTAAARSDDLPGIQRKLTQAGLASAAGLPAASISHFESGVRFPSGKSLRKLADALNVSVDFLLGRTDVPSADLDGPRFQAIFRNIRTMSDEALRDLEELSKTLAELDQAKRREQGEKGE